MISILRTYKYMYATHLTHTRPGGKLGKLFGMVKFVVSHRFIFPKSKDPVLSAALQAKELAQYITIKKSGEYIYPFDMSVVRCLDSTYNQIASVTMDYNKILESGLNRWSEYISSCPDEQFKSALTIAYESFLILIDRVVSFLKTDRTRRGHNLLMYFQSITGNQCQTFDEAIQRILFYNAVLWQNKYKQNGLGRLDLILAPYYDKGIAEGSLTREKAKAMLQSMCFILGKDMAQKSASLIGDTGQVILIGGVDKDGKTVENELTHIFLEIFTEHPAPDPKLILRVNKHTSDVVWHKAVNCIIKGSGSPLILNEDQVIPLMEKFGYAKEDVYNFGTSACWEPLIIGKSLDQNNCIKNITILDALTSTLRNHDNETYDDLLINLDDEIAKLIAKHDLTIEFDKAPVLSLFFDDCIEKGVDFANGGAKYNNHGLLVVGLPNLINSLLNIKKYVYESKICSLEQCLECIYMDYRGHKDLQQLFRFGAKKFGSADKDVIDLTNHIMEEVGKAVGKRQMFGKKIKVGFSSPSYIGLAKNYPASLDGRNKNDPFAVHISPISSDIDFAEILDFASQLKYDGCRINGNVVDFILPTSYVMNPDKLKAIIIDACAKGLFELQLNVLDKATLIDAKAHPEKYPNLVVRVWGFSAYFNDLPDEYKENLIKRVECYEA